MTTAEFIVCELLGCGELDIEPLFGKLTDTDYFSDSVQYLKENGCELSADSIWSECILNVFRDVFGDDDYPDLYFNFIDSRVSLNSEIAKNIEDFTEKANKFYDLSGFEIELYDE